MGVDNRSERFVNTEAFDLRLGAEDDAVAQDREREGLHVVRDDEVAAADLGERLRAIEKRKSGARGAADEEICGVTGGVYDGADVVEDLFLDAGLADLALQGDELFGGGDGLDSGFA